MLELAVIWETDQRSLQQLIRPDIIALARQFLCRLNRQTGLGFGLQRQSFGIPRLGFQGLFQIF